MEDIGLCGNLLYQATGAVFEGGFKSSMAPWCGFLKNVKCEILISHYNSSSNRVENNSPMIVAKFLKF